MSTTLADVLRGRRGWAFRAACFAFILMVPTPLRAQHRELLVSADWLASHLDDANLVILHVDDEAQYGNGHIPGARLLDHMALVTDRPGASHVVAPPDRVRSAFEAAGISDDSRVVVYGPSLSAARTFWTLEYVGLAGQVSLLDGGLESWRAAEYPLSTDQPAVRPGHISAHPDTAVLATAAWVYQHLDDEAVFLLDARPDRIRAQGYIPGSRQLDWSSLMQGPRSPFLKPTPVLQELFTAAGYQAGQTVTTYCTVGLRASMAYVVARYLGFEVRMYDGSMNEWSQTDGMPVSR